MLRQPLPRVALPNPTSAAAPGARIAAGDHVVSGSHVAGAARQVLLNNILGLPSPPPPPGVDTNLAESSR
jgi:hypothetical protein